MAQMKKSYRLALGGLIAALSVVLMFMVNLFPFADYTLPAVAGLLLVIVMIELNARWALAVYVAVSLLTLLVTPLNQAVLLYIFFFGYYPVVKAAFEKCKSRIVEWVVKLVLFNAVVAVIYLLLRFVLNLPDVLQNDWGKWGAAIFLLLANAAFVLYDLCVSRLASLYIARIRPILLRRFK